MKNLDEKNLLNEELDRVILRKAVEQYLDDSSEYEALLKETLANGPHQFSQAHEAKMKALIAETDKKKPKHSAKRGFRRVGIAAAAVVLFFSAGGSYLVSDADWEDLRNFFMQRQPTHTEVILPEDIGEEYWKVLKDAGWDKVYYPSYVPEGFVLTNVDAMNVSCILGFERYSQIIKIRQSSLEYGAYFHIDTEGALVRPIDINGYAGEYVEKGDTRIIHFRTEDYYFMIESEGVSSTQLVKVTKNLKLLENTK